VTNTNAIYETEEKQKTMLYEKEIVCPVCGNVFKVKAVKSSSYRIIKKDTDFLIHYSVINPYFYDVWLCNKCGYTAMKADFDHIKVSQKGLIEKLITPRFKSKNYGETYSLESSIERFKLALINYITMESISSKKAMVCLKIAWMYRLMEDSNNEKTYLQQALDSFNQAYMKEDFPIYGMDKYTLMYLLGELNRRLDKKSEALKWFSMVVTTPGANAKAKQLARDQKEVLREDELKAQAVASMEELKEENKKDNKFFKLFK